MKIFLFILSIYLSIELFIYIFFPKFLNANQFDEGDVVVKDKELGWKQKANVTFRFLFLKSQAQEKSFSTILLFSSI